MNRLSKIPVFAAACVAACLCGSGVAQATSSECEKAWANYNEFKKRTVMEPSQYALTTEGAAVRVACGNDALPVPPGSDTPLMPIIRDHNTSNRPVKPTHPIVLPPSTAPTPPIVTPRPPVATPRAN
jgi:hypothetical protein